MIHKFFNFIKSDSGRITIYAMLEKMIDILVSLLTGIIVIRYLNISDYGVISALSGYATIINILNIAPINFLYKEYGRGLKSKLSEKLSSYTLFEKYKSILLIVIYLIIGLYLSVTKETYGFIIIAIANGCSVSIEIFTNINRSVLELNFHQKKITKAIFFARIIKLGISSLLLIYPSLWIIFIRDILVALFEKTYLRFLTKNYYQVLKSSFKQMICDVKESFTGFCIANHFSGVLTNIIYGSDTMFLSMFWNQEIVGKYGITLTCLNYFNPFFQVLQKNTMIELGASGSYDKDIGIVKKYTKLSCLLSIVCFLGYMLLGKLMFYIFTGDKSLTELTFSYGIYIFAGVCLYNCVRPLTAFLSLRGNINKYLLQTILPAAIFSTIIYFISAKYFDLKTVAIANIISYGFWVLLVILYLIRNKQYIQRINKEKPHEK